MTRTLVLIAGGVAALSASRIGAQTGTQIGTAAADSAAVARDAASQMNAALQRGDLTSARAHIERAARAWPVQPAYIWARAVLAARAGDRATLEQSLAQYADFGLGRDLRANPELARLLGASFEGVAARHDANRAVAANSTPRPLLSDSTFWPEGIDADPRTGKLYVASVRHRVVAEVSPDGSSRELWRRDRNDLASTLGVRVDTARNSIWATTSGIRGIPGFQDGDTANASLLRFDLASGEIAQRFDLPVVNGGHVLGDLAIGPDGSVWVTDSKQPIIYRLRPNARALEQVRSPLFYSLQGIAPTPDGKWVYITDYALGVLRMNLATGAIVALANPASGTAIGSDGIVWSNGAIIAVQNGVSPARIIRIVPDEQHDRLLSIERLDQNSAIADEPTIGTIFGDAFVYIANSQWEKFNDAGERVAARPLTPPIALRLRLPH